ncbi:MAG: FAD-binding protein [Hyphomicrobiales bacterium]|nr:FAD-binding protein [Hyphomicrobiales bacterium]
MSDAAPAGFATVDTDVLVIGGGLAALRAALSARSAGARVTMAVKRLLARSGSSSLTTGGYAAASCALNPQDNPDLHYADTIAGGAFVNERRLVRALVDEAPLRLPELWEMGAAFRMREGRYHLSPSGDHSQARVLVPQNMRGGDMTLPMRAAVLARGVDVIENCTIADLLTDDGRVSGAVGAVRGARPIVVRAAATVLAAGGAGRLFPITSNPPVVCGGGFALALRAGARLRDMEFIQFYPWRLIRPFKSMRVPVQPSTFAMGGRLYNRRGERFMERYDPQRKESTTRDLSARGIFDQIRAGLDVDGGVILDVSQVPDDQFRYENAKVITLLEPKRIDYRAIELVVAPEAHFVMGGVAIDEHGRADFAGLYAAGENAGGVHGGNRLNSNAVPETQVFGHRAGVEAARLALAAPAGRFDPRPIERLRTRLADLQSDADEVAPAFVALHDALKQAMNLGIGIVRSHAGLAGALADADAISDRLAGLAPRSLGELIAAMEIADLCAIGRVCAESAMARTESRAAHYRDDFPAGDPGWVRTVTFGPKGLAVEPIDIPADEAMQFARLAKSQPAAAKASEREYVE